MRNKKREVEQNSNSTIHKKKIMAKICFPHHTRGHFDSLDEAVACLKKSRSGWRDYLLDKIVQYNICYRDHLRAYGITSLISKLAEEATSLDDESFRHLRQWWSRIGHIAAYDIQCYGIGDRITVCGHTFNGLEDIRAHCEIIGKECFTGFECFTPKDFEVYDNVHIGEIYESYPIFDSSDLCDDRTFQNYIFRKKPVTETVMKNAFKIPHGINCCMVHENIPEHLLPVLYYEGDGGYMLLATKKEQTCLK